MIIRELPEMERPREKLSRYGKEHLTNTELIALLLGTGSRGESSIGLAENLLALDEAGLLHLANCSVEELSRVKGMGLAKACKLLAAMELGSRVSTTQRPQKTKIESTADVVEIFMEKMRYHKKEYFNVLLLNAKGEILAVETVAIGDLSSSIVHPREAFLAAVKKSAAAVIFIHNHPSGNPKPSPQDIEVTNRLCETGKILGIHVLDHIIIGDGIYISMKEKKIF
jgi:DNA repair protein RadC